MTIPRCLEIALDNTDFDSYIQLFNHWNEINLLFSEKNNGSQKMRMEHNALVE